MRQEDDTLSSEGEHQLYLEGRREIKWEQLPCCCYRSVSKEVCNFCILLPAEVFFSPSQVSQNLFIKKKITKSENNVQLEMMLKMLTEKKKCQQLICKRIGIQIGLPGDA